MTQSNLEIYYYIDENGIAPVREYLLELPEGWKTKAIPEKDLKIALDRKENSEVLLKFDKADFDKENGQNG